MTQNSNEEKELKTTAKIHKDLDVRIPAELRVKLFKEVGFGPGDKVSFKSKVNGTKLVLTLEKVS